MTTLSYTTLWDTTSGSFVGCGGPKDEGFRFRGNLSIICLV